MLPGPSRSPSISIGLSASPNAPIATSTAMCGRCSPRRASAAALLAELEWEAARLGPRPLRSIFFGGGTPSLMEPETVAALIARRACVSSWPMPDIEITLEANPTSIEAGRFAASGAAGVNRISLGRAEPGGCRAAPARPPALRRRRRSRRWRSARRLFPRISFDLIYARPGQTEAAWRAELALALDLAADHLSLYQLTIEPGTVFEGAASPWRDPSCPRTRRPPRLYEATATEAAARFGLLPYEVSNYAQPGLGEPAQPHLLALRRLRRHRAGRAWAAEPGGGPHRDPAPPRAGNLGRAGRARRPWVSAGECCRPRPSRRRKCC